MEEFWSQSWPLITLSIIFSIFLTWFIGLLPVFLIRYFIFHRPLSKFWSIFLVTIFWLFNIALFEFLGSHSTIHPSLFLVGLASYYIYRTNKGFRTLIKDILSFIVSCGSLNYLSVFLWLRYLGKKRVLLLSIAAVALSCALLVVVASLFTGFINTFKRSASDALGDIVISPPEKIENYRELTRELEELNCVEAATGTLSAQGLLHIGRGNVRAVEISGIELQKEGRVTGFDRSLLKGNINVSDTSTAGFVGIGVLTEPNEKTDEYDFKAVEQMIGQTAVLTTGSMVNDQDGSGQFKRRTIQFNITDVVFTGVYYLDKRIVYLPIERVREVVYPEETKPIAGKIHIKLKSSIDTEAALAQIHGVWRSFAAEKLGWTPYEAEQTIIITSRQMQARYVAEIRKQMGVLLLIFGVVSLSAVLLVFCIFYMIVETKRRDVAIMKSCGATGTTVAVIFVGFGAFIGIIGTAAGTALGYIVTKNINVIEGWIRVIFGLKLWKASVYMFSRIPTEVDWPAVVWIVLSAIAGAAIGAAIPAISAAMTRPVNVLRYE